MKENSACRHPESTDASGFVLVSDIIPDAVLDIRYYSTFNFLGERVDGYEEPIALLTKEAADALKEVSDDAVSRGYRLKIFDCYRPQCAVDHFIRWAEQHRELAMKNYFYPEVDKRRLFDLGFVAQRSGHSRGSTVDLTLLDMATQKDLDVGGTFDYFGTLSWSQYTDSITQEQIENRKMLRELMTSHGFHPLAEEWWHFTLDNEPYPDTYFTFPVSSGQVKQLTDFRDKMERDMEFRLRFYDVVAQSDSRTREIIDNAVRTAFASASADICAFASRESVRIDDTEMQRSMDKLHHAVNQAIAEILKSGQKN